MSEMTARQKQAIATRNKIYQCAMDLFVEYSYERVTVKEICKAAEVSIGGFYHYFSSKMDILNDGYRLFDERVREDLTKYTIEDPLDKILFLIGEQCRSAQSLGVSAFAQLFKSQLTSEEKYIVNTERFFYHEMESSVSKAIDKGLLVGKEEIITEEILSVARGLIYDWILHEGSYDLKERSLKMVRIILEYYKRNYEEGQER